MNSSLMFSRASDEWSTPQDLFDLLDAEFDFELDAAATQENTKTEPWLGLGSSLGDDALKHSWGSRFPWPPTVWLNPPYSRCREFIAKAAEEAFQGCTVVCLVPSRTDTRWWHEHVWDAERHQPRPDVEVRFLRGRLKFGGSPNSAPFPSVIIVFRPC